MAGLAEGSQGRQRSKTAVTRCRTVAPAVAGTRQRVFQMISVAGNLVIRFFRRDYQKTGCLGCQVITGGHLGTHLQQSHL